MRPDSKFNWSVLFVAIVLGILGGPLFFPRTLQGITPQQRERVLRRLPIERNEPVRIKRVVAKGRSVMNNEKFSSEDDWLRGLTISVSNKAQQAIVFVAIQLQFPRPRGSLEPIAITSIEYGSSNLMIRSLTAADVSFAPGQTVNLNMPDERFEALRRGLSEIGYSNGGERVNLRIDCVIFEDGRMWRAGELFQRDGSTPGLWINSNLARLNRTDGRQSSTLVASSISTDTSRNAAKPLLNRSSLFTKQRLFSHATAAVQTCNQRLDWSTRLSCSEGTFCTYPYDQMSLPTGGNYYGASASALCKSGTTSCDTWRSTIIANSCGTSGGGGDGGGGVGSEGGGCSTSWDCYAGEVCSNGHCEQIGGGGPGGIEPE